MAGYLDNYGVVEERRGRIIKKIAIWTVSAVVVITSGYFYFRTWGEERTVKRFLTALQNQDFQGGYKMWGCTQDTPCVYYPPDKYNRDWGPSTPYSHTEKAKIENIDVCGSGVVFNISFPGAEPVALWVEQSTDRISFAPWSRCPGRHLNFQHFFRSLFSS